MARTSKNEKIIFTINGNNRSKSSEINSNRKVRQSEEIDIQEMLHQLERTRMRRNASADTSAVSKNTSTTCQQDCYHQLAERVRELEKEIVPDHHFFQVPPVYSPFSALTPCSNTSGSGFSNYSRPQNFPRNLLSPNSSVPTQRFGLSPKFLERAHQIPERFWIDWQQKQMQNRIEELECMKKNDLDSPINNRRKSLLLLHELQHRMNLSRSKPLNRVISASMDTETSSSSSTTDDHSLFNFDRRSIDGNTFSPQEPTTPKSSSTLNRSRLTICIPFANINLPKQSVEKSIDLIETISSASSIEDIAQIDTELKLTLLSQENPDQTNPLLYSKVILNRTIEFRSSSKKD